MDASVSGGPKRCPSFPVGVRMPSHSISGHVCFFCGETFSHGPDYQRHIVHEHQMASIAYQIYAQDHPPPNKREKREEEGRKRRKNSMGENGDEKKWKMDSSLDTPLHALPSPVDTALSPPVRSTTAPAISAQSSLFTFPSESMKTSLPPGRYPANKLLHQQHHMSMVESTADEGSSEGSFVSMVREGHKTDAPCAVCGARYQNATALVMHSINEHNATILKIEKLHHYGDRIIPSLDFEFTEDCIDCDLKTPTLTKCFEHSIVHHKGNLVKGTDANAVTYNITCEVPSSKVNFNVRIRLRKAPNAISNV